MIYFDTSYLVRLYFDDPGAEAVRELATTDNVVCCILGRAETVAALHRKLREGAVTQRVYQTLLSEFVNDTISGAFHWLPLSEAVLQRVASMFAGLPASVFLRGSDALHLGCAAENGVREIYTNDSHLLTAAPHFGLKGINIL